MKLLNYPTPEERRLQEEVYRLQQDLGYLRVKHDNLIHQRENMSREVEALRKRLQEAASIARPVIWSGSPLQEFNVTRVNAQTSYVDLKIRIDAAMMSQAQDGVTFVATEVAQALRKAGFK